jgi:hypothetical protein
MVPRQFQLGGAATGIGRSPFIQLIAEFPRKRYSGLSKKITPECSQNQLLKTESILIIPQSFSHDWQSFLAGTFYTAL